MPTCDSASSGKMLGEREAQEVQPGRGDKTSQVYSCVGHSARWKPKGCRQVKGHNSLLTLEENGGRDRAVAKHF